MSTVLLPGSTDAARRPERLQTYVSLKPLTLIDSCIGNGEFPALQHVTATRPGLKAADCAIPWEVNVSAKRTWRVNAATAAKPASSI